MTDFKSFRTNLEEKKGLWDNIHAKRKRGEKPNPPGHPDRPTAQDFKDAQKKESVEEKKTANEAKDGDGANIVRDREFKGKKLSSQPRAKPGDKGFNSYDKLFKKGGQKPAWMDREKMKKESLDISEISLDMLTKKISNSGMDTTKKANKMDKTKNDLAAMKARLAGKPAMAKESVELDEAVHTVEIDHDGDQDHDAFKHKITLKHNGGGAGATATGKKKDLQKYLTKHYVGRSYAKDVHPEVFESVELDELSKKTLGSYIKKADKQADKAADSYSNAAMRRSDFAPDTPAMAKNAKKFAKRDAGADLARRKLAKEAYEDDEPASPDEASMAMRQLGFIEYAAEEVMDHIKSGKEFPEWMQNKLSKLHGQMESLHSALGEHGEDDEEMKEAVSNNMRLISKIKNSGVVKTGSMAKDTKPAPKKEGVNTADKKPEKFVKPDGTVGVRMVPVDKQIVDKDK